MRTRASGRDGRVLTRALLSVVVLGGGSSMAAAQTTVTLDNPRTDVVWATVRGGSFAGKNDQSMLTTRTDSGLDNDRRALLKFDTQKGIPEGAAVTSAVLTVTVTSGGAD